jgi:hypothetical protein
VPKRIALRVTAGQFFLKIHGAPAAAATVHENAALAPKR